MRYTQQARPDPHRTHHPILDVSVYRFCRDVEQVGCLCDRPQPTVADIHHLAFFHRFVLLACRYRKGGNVPEPLLRNVLQMPAGTATKPSSVPVSTGLGAAQQPQLGEWRAQCSVVRTVLRRDTRGTGCSQLHAPTNKFTRGHRTAPAASGAPAKRGRPKIPWAHFDDEVWRRARSGNSAVNAWAEARYLEDWAQNQGLKTKGSKPAHIMAQAIYARMRRRIGGASHFQDHIAWQATEELPPSLRD
jgi:hypothetical protein